MKNKSKRYSRRSRLSDTPYSAKRVRERWRYASSKSTVHNIVYPRSRAT